MHLIQPLTKLPEHMPRIRLLLHAVSYRIALPVTQIVRYSVSGSCCPLCPRCKSSLDREYASFCDRCGQKLCWDRLDYAEILIAPIRK